MDDHKSKISKKLFIIRTYQSLSPIKSVLRNISQKNNNQLQVSILAKLTSSKISAKKDLLKRLAAIKKDLKVAIGEDFQCGYFYNPEFGWLFIAGHLTPTFLNKVDEIALASLPAGLLGIFRGMGIQKENINSYLEELRKDNYCLIIRAESLVLDVLEPLLT